MFEHSFSANMVKMHMGVIIYSRIHRGGHYMGTSLSNTGFANFDGGQHDNTQSLGTNRVEICVEECTGVD